MRLTCILLFFTLTAAVPAQVDLLEGTVSVRVKDYYFINGKDGWFLDNHGALYKTNDAGNTLNPINDMGSDYRNHNIYFVTENAGFLYGPEGSLLRTEDGGSTWEPVTVYSNHDLTAMQFVDELNGWCVGMAGYNQQVVLRTEDGGNVWYAQQLPRYVALHAVYFNDAGQGVLGGHYNLVMYSPNRGKTWEEISYKYVNPSRTGYHNSFRRAQGFGDHFYVSGYGLGEFYSPAVYYSFDRGESFTLTGAPAKEGVSVIYLDEQKALANDHGVFYYTIDNWETVKVVEVAGAGNYQDFAFFEGAGAYCIRNHSVYKVDESYFPACDADTSIIEDLSPSKAPTEFFVYQNFPNPFNPVTTIQYTLPEPGFVRLMISNIMGQEITTLVSRIQAASEYQVKFCGNGLPSGTYLYRLEFTGETKNHVEVKKCLLLK